MDYQIKLFSHLDEELKKNWFIVEEDSCHTCFNSLAWIENYISTYKETNSSVKLRIFVIFFKNEPFSIFPFEIVKKYQINVLQWVGDKKSDFNAPLQRKKFIFEKSMFKNAWC